MGGGGGGGGGGGEKGGVNWACKCGVSHACAGKESFAFWKRVAVCSSARVQEFRPQGLSH